MPKTKNRADVTLSCKIDYFCNWRLNQIKIIMRRIVLMFSAIVLMAGCKNTEEVKIDETKVETPADTIPVAKDTVAAIKGDHDDVAGKIEAEASKPEVE